MAYVDLDRRERLSPSGLGVAILMSGGVLAAIASMGADAIPALHRDDILRIFPIAQPAPPPDQAVEKPRTAAPDPGPITIESRPPDLPPLTGGTAQTGITLPPLPPLPPGTGTGPVDPPHVPVRIVASTLPGYRTAFQPPYPSGLIRAEIEGKATVRVLIAVDGRVKAVEAVRADHEDFLEATRVQALRKWRFKPATVDGVPVESWKEMTVSFVMPR